MGHPVSFSDTFHASNGFTAVDSPVVQQELVGVAYLSEADVDDWLGDEGGLVVVVHAELVLGLTNLKGESICDVQGDAQKVA